ncbi:MAG: hypothetical protein ACNI25_09935 [Halarcobacter sp.]
MFNLIVKRKVFEEFFFYLFILVPYLSVFTKQIDTSPYALIISTYIFILIKNKSLPYHSYILLFGSFFAFLIIFITHIELLSIRSFLGYFSLFIISSSTYFVLKKNNGFNYKLFIFFVYLWFFVGLVQLFIDESFMTFLLDRYRSGGGRGVTGLAPEPTYYGTVALFIFFISVIINYRVKLIFFISLIEVVFLSKSSTAILLVLVLIFIYGILNLKFKTIILYIVGAISFYFFIIDYLYLFQGNRFYGVLRGILEDPLYLMTRDESVSERLFHVFFAYKGFFDNYGLPNGFTSFKLYLTENLPIYYPYTELIKPTRTIMSGIGGIFFELGFMGFIYIFFFFLLIKQAEKNFTKAMFLFLYLMIILNTSVPLTFPYIGFVIGILLYKLNHKEKF